MALREWSILFANGVEKSDPSLMPLRISSMLTLTREPEMIDIAANIGGAMRLVTAGKENKPVTGKDKKQFSDQTIWMLAVRERKDKAAFAELFDFFAPRLKSFIMRSGTSAGQAEEIVQDVMLTVWCKAGQFDPHRAQVSAWIYQIARNRQIDVIRKENKPLPEELTAEPENVPDAGQVVAVEQEAQNLRRALQTLNPEQRTMIEKAYLGELTHQDIRDQTGLPLGTIKSRIRLGLERLRHELKGMR